MVGMDIVIFISRNFGLLTKLKTRELNEKEV